MSNMSKSKTLLCTIALAASGLLAQVQAPAPLIHLHPVALDASGQPVTDLTAGDFKIVDQTKSQTIFASISPPPGPPAPERSGHPGTALTAANSKTVNKPKPKPSFPSISPPPGRLRHLRRWSFPT